MSINKKYRLPRMIIRGGTSKGLYFLENYFTKLFTYTNYKIYGFL